MTEELKMPADERAREALDAHFKAVALYARRRELVERAQQSLPEAAAEVERTHQVCVDLGLIPAPTRARAARRPTTGPAPAGGPTLRERALAALPGTAAEIREKTGLGAPSIGPTLNAMLKAGEVDRDGEPGSYVWRRAA